MTDPLGHVTSFTYDTGGAHLLLTMILPNGQSGGPDSGQAVVNTYDSQGRVLTQTDASGFETTFVYTGENFSSSGGTTTVTDPNGNVEQETYVNGEMTSVTKGYGTSSPSTTTYSYDPSSLGTTSTTNPDGDTSTATYDADGNVLTSTNALGNTTTYSYNFLDEQTCKALPEAASPCADLSPPTDISGGGTISPPSAVPPAYVTFTQYDTDGNKLWSTTGVYPPGSSTASYSKTSYDLYNGESVTLEGTTDSCTTTAPSTSLPCATISPDRAVTQLTYDSHGDLTSSSTPDGNSGGEVAKTTYSYDTDGEETSSVSPDGNLPAANSGNFTTSKSYNADGEVTSVTVGGGSGATVVPRTTTYAYDADGNRTSTSQSTSIQYIGSTAGRTPRHRSPCRCPVRLALETRPSFRRQRSPRQDRQRRSSITRRTTRICWPERRKSAAMGRRACKPTSRGSPIRLGSPSMVLGTSMSLASATTTSRKLPRRTTHSGDK